MNCERFKQAWVGDDEAERDAAERHASTCPECARIVEGDRELALLVGEWKAAAPEPRAGLQRRIGAAIAGSRKPAPQSYGVWIGAIAAALVLGVAVLLRVLSIEAAIDPVEQAVRDADRIQHDYARAIARLQQQADTILARSGDATLESERAARLLAYRDRLSHLDTVIAEVQEFLEQNPGHSGGHTVLLAAYKEKDQVLREIVELPRGEDS